MIYLALLIVLLFALPVRAQIAVSANDTTEILMDGARVMVPDAPPDTVTLIDLSARAPRIIAELNAPSSWSGPPQMVAVTPDESVALLSSSLKVNPADPTMTTQDNKISVIDLKSSPPAVIKTLDAGLFPNGIAINAAGTLALVTNRGDSTVSIYTISGTSVTPAGHISLQDKNCGPSMPAFTPDGSTSSRREHPQDPALHRLPSDACRRGARQPLVPGRCLEQRRTHGRDSMHD